MTYSTPLFRFSAVSRSFAPRLSAVFAALFLMLVCAAPPARAAEGWNISLAEHAGTPAYVVAVDKSRQELSFFERRSPLRLTRVFACSTGQAAGDKLVQGDLKTPEGVYFVVQRIGSGLDFIKYGREAYTLNYPNPIDRLRRKTGYGIWVHGRGEPLARMQTEGCVSLLNDDLDMLGKLLKAGTPVILGQSLSFSAAPDSQDAADAGRLEQNVKDWAEAWSNRSPSYLDFYDGEAYSLAQGQPFSAFASQKLRLFSVLPWVRTTVRDIQVLKGPGYWVTWFYQDYQAPNLSTRGVRRLYWGKNESGEFKILGMEWHPGMSTSTLLASADSLLPALDLKGKSPWDSIPEAPVLAKNAAAAPEAPSRDAPKAALDHVEDPAQGEMARPSAEAFVLARTMQVEKEQRAEAAGLDIPAAPQESATAAETPEPEAAAAAPAKKETAKAVESDAAAAEELLPPPLPSQRLTKADKAAAADGGKAQAEEKARRDLLAAGADSPQPAPQAEYGEEHAPAKTPAAASEPEGSAAPPAQKPEEAVAELVASLPEAAPAASATPEEALETVRDSLEQWRLAWESGDLDAYMSFYASNAVQGSRSGGKAIRRQKQRLWETVRPASVSLRDVRVSVKDGGIVAVMRQVYQDNRGGGDDGVKTLTFSKINGAWRITHEDWSPLP